MPKDVNENTSTETSPGNGRWRGSVEADIKNILRLVIQGAEYQDKLFAEVHALAQRVAVVETKATAVDAVIPNVALKEDVVKDIKDHASHENRNNVLSGGGGTVGGIAVWEAIRAWFM